MEYVRTYVLANPPDSIRFDLILFDSYQRFGLDRVRSGQVDGLTDFFLFCLLVMDLDLIAFAWLGDFYYRYYYYCC